MPLPAQSLTLIIAAQVAIANVDIIIMKHRKELICLGSRLAVADKKSEKFRYRNRKSLEC